MQEEFEAAKRLADMGESTLAFVLSLSLAEQGDVLRRTGATREKALRIYLNRRTADTEKPCRQDARQRQPNRARHRLLHPPSRLARCMCFARVCFRFFIWEMGVLSAIYGAIRFIRRSFLLRNRFAVADTFFPPGFSGILQVE
jgi:hypothetical protein